MPIIIIIKKRFKRNIIEKDESPKRPCSLYLVFL